MSASVVVLLRLLNAFQASLITFRRREIKTEMTPFIHLTTQFQCHLLRPLEEIEHGERGCYWLMTCGVSFIYSFSVHPQPFRWRGQKKKIEASSACWLSGSPIYLSAEYKCPLHKVSTPINREFLSIGTLTFSMHSAGSWTAEKQLYLSLSFANRWETMLIANPLPGLANLHASSGGAS